MSTLKITPVVVDTEELITAIARLLALSKISETELDRDSFCQCAAEFCTLLQLDSKRCMERATEILDNAKEHAAAAWN